MQNVSIGMPFQINSEIVPEDYLYFSGSK